MTTGSLRFTLRDLTLAALVGLFAFVFVARDLGTDVLSHTDEPGYSRESLEAYRRFFHDGDHASLWWLQSRGATGVELPMVTKYLIGASLWWHGFRSVDDLQADERGLLVSWPVRFAARFPSAILAGVLAASTFLLVQLVTGTRLAGLLTTAGLLTSWQILLHAHNAMADIPAAALSAAAVLLLLYSIHLRLYFPGDRWKTALALIGWVTFGLAVGAKLNAGLHLATFAVLYAGYLGVLARRHMLTRALLVATCAEVAVGGALVALVFWTLTPALWHDLRVITVMWSFGASMIPSQRASFADAALFTLPQKLDAFYRFSLATGAWLPGLAAPLALVAGVAVLVRRRKTFAALGYAAATLIAVAVVIVWVPLAWDRYFLPASIFIIPLQWMGVWLVVTGVVALVRRLVAGIIAAATPRPNIAPGRIALAAVALGLVVLGVGWWVTTRTSGFNITDLDAAISYHAAGDCRQALPLDRELIARGIGDSMPDIVLKAADCARTVGDSATAARYYEQALDYDLPHRSDIYFALGALYRGNEIHWKTLDYLRAAVQVGDFSSSGVQSDAYNVLALEEWWNNADMSVVIGDFELSVQANPGNFWSHKILGDLYYSERRDVEQAIASLKRAIALKPEEPGAYVSLGDVYRGEQQTVPACANYSQAAQFDPTNETLVERLKECASSTR